MWSGAAVCHHPRPKGLARFQTKPSNVIPGHAESNDQQLLKQNLKWTSIGSSTRQRGVIPATVQD